MKKFIQTLLLAAVIQSSLASGEEAEPPKPQPVKKISAQKQAAIDRWAELSVAIIKKRKDLNPKKYIGKEVLFGGEVKTITTNTILLRTESGIDCRVLLQEKFERPEGDAISLSVFATVEVIDPKNRKVTLTGREITVVSAE